MTHPRRCLVPVDPAHCLYLTITRWVTNKLHIPLGVAAITVGYDCIVDSPIAPAMKLDVSAVHMDSTLIWTLFASVNHWLLVSTSNRRERRDVPEGCNATPWKSC